jgi:hypothetical protein
VAIFASALTGAVAAPPAMIKPIKVTTGSSKINRGGYIRGDGGAIGEGCELLMIMFCSKYFI